MNVKPWILLVSTILVIGSIYVTIKIDSIYGLILMGIAAALAQHEKILKIFKK